MPFKSEAQRRKFYAMAGRGEISRETVKHWEEATPKGKKLPEHVAKHASLAKYALLGPVGKAALTGGGIAAAIGGVTGYFVPSTPQGSWDRHPTTSTRWKSALRSAAGFAPVGVMLGVDAALRRSAGESNSRFWEEWSAAGRGAARPGPKPSWVGDVTTKAEAKARYRQEAMKHHPDRGGNEDIMKKVNAEWEAFTRSHAFNKLSMAAFVDELTKIADLAGLVLGQLARREVTPPVTQAISNLEDRMAERWRRFGAPDLESM